MSAYLPAFELTPIRQEAIKEGGLKISRGQWVRWRGALGRFLGLDRDGQLRILWKFHGERFASFVLRFKRALLKRIRRAVKKGEQLAFDFVFGAERTASSRCNELAEVLERHKKTGWRVYAQLRHTLAQLTSDSEAHRAAGRIGLRYCEQEIQRVAKRERWALCGK